MLYWSEYSPGTATNIQATETFSNARTTALTAYKSLEEPITISRMSNSSSDPYHMMLSFVDYASLASCAKLGENMLSSSANTTYQHWRDAFAGELYPPPSFVKRPPIHDALDHNAGKPIPDI